MKASGEKKEIKSDIKWKLCRWTICSTWNRFVSADRNGRLGNRKTKRHRLKTIESAFVDSEQLADFKQPIKEN